jgi:hypothetical protein
MSINLYNNEINSFLQSTNSYYGLISYQHFMGWKICFFALIILSVVFALVLAIFLMLHLQLVLNNRTTIESMERVGASSTFTERRAYLYPNWWNLGSLYNLQQVFGDSYYFWWIPMERKYSNKFYRNSWRNALENERKQRKQQIQTRKTQWENQPRSSSCTAIFESSSENLALLEAEASGSLSYSKVMEELFDLGICFPTTVNGSLEPANHPQRHVFRITTEEENIDKVNNTDKLGEKGEMKENKKNK